MIVSGRERQKEASAEAQKRKGTSGGEKSPILLKQKEKGET